MIDTLCSRRDGLKTIPWTVAHTRIVNIWEYPLRDFIISRTPNNTHFTNTHLCPFQASGGKIVLLGHILSYLQFFAPRENWGEQNFALVKWCIPLSYVRTVVRYFLDNNKFWNLSKMFVPIVVFIAGHE